MINAQATQEQKISLFEHCVNINAVNKYDSTRVFCWVKQDWVNLANCQCSKKMRSTRVDQSW